MAEDRRLKQIASLSQDELYQLAMIDELTGVYNRRALLTYLDELIKSAELSKGTVSLLVLDIDKFKSINDTYGHLTGDKAIVEIANFLTEGVRENDIVARYGGDEFVVILPDAPEERAGQIAERIREQVAQKKFMAHDSNQEIKMSLSFGLAVYPKDAKDSKTLFTQADRALYASKRAVRNKLSRISDVSYILEKEENLNVCLNDPPLVGRDAQMQTIMRAYEEAKGGRRKFMIIQSKPGFGKSKMLDGLNKNVQGNTDTFMHIFRCRREEI